MRSRGRQIGLYWNVVEGTAVEGTVVDGTVVEGTVVDGTVVEGTLVDGTVVEPTLGVVPKALAPPEALDEPMPGVAPTLLPKRLDGVPNMPGVVVTAPGATGVVDGLMLGAEPKEVAPPEALEEPMSGVAPTLLPKRLDGEPVVVVAVPAGRLMIGVEPMALAPPEALDEPIAGVVPTLLPKTLEGVPVAPGIVVTVPGVVTAPGERT